MMERKRSSRRYRYRPRKSWAERCKDYLRHFLAFMFSNVGIIGLVVGYTIAGAFMFMAIEGSEPGWPAHEAERMRSETAARLWRLTEQLNPIPGRARWAEAVAPELARYQRDVVRLVRDGFDGSSARPRSQWTFSGAFLYSLTVITTIGYGNVTPKTEWGKLATIVYAIVGMPLFLLYLSNIGDILARSFKWTFARLCLCRGCARRRRLPPPPPPPPWQRSSSAPASFQEFQMERRAPPMRRSLGQRPLGTGAEVGVGVGGLRDLDGGGGAFSEDGVVSDPEADEDLDDSADEDSTSSTSSYDPQSVTVPVTLCLAIMVGYVCGGAFLFSEWESWDFLDGSYFCFISLSTIGFGDIVPGDKIYSEGIELSFIFCSMYLMLGMALIAMCFNLMQEEVVHKIRSCARSVRNCFGCR
ncbi:TWiK family of potassium channels protein 18 [Schistocerca piceifrons]|uniref:TWiK family of potassium channels protein 18 n=1 Tax=Schistocerca piceifrons TaxID=274613 RepID=UPI001F5E4AA6|nr:TWiK family of potassium channels protein 18 [Schistocerca piceifrons]